MAYNALAQRELEQDDLLDEPPPPIASSFSRSFQPLPQLDFHHSPSPPLFMDHQHEPASLSTTNTAMPALLVSSSTRPIYDILDDEDDDDDDNNTIYDTRLSTSTNPVWSSTKTSQSVPATIDSARAQHSQPTNRHQASSGLAAILDRNSPHVSAPRSQRIAPDAPIRTASGRRVPLRHPTPDLHSLQGAFMANVEHLEKTAEKLSMTSSIDDAIRQMHDDQKRSDSRRSSLLTSPIDAPIPTRQFSGSGSIVDVNNAARSGGFSPGGFNLISPRDMPTTTRARSSSKGSRFSSRPEPELEGRPLDSFANFSFSGGSPTLSFTGNNAEQDESTLTITQPSLDPPPLKLRISNPDQVDEPMTPASATTFEHAERLFSDFDGQHFAPTLHAASESGRSAGGSQMGAGSRVSSGDRTSMIRPQTYADPDTGQKMVFYPAPVPMMLNLPQKISRLSQSEAARAKRRSQVLSSIPAATRQSTLWLPDVLEDEGDSQRLQDDLAKKQEYMAQHQRATMGGRRSTQDLQHLPPQLRASAFFDVPGPSQLVEVKEASAVKTLDSILDASAFAPVSAFTDHLIAGKLGAEVYGNSNRRSSRPMNKSPEPGELPKRRSFANLLKPRRASSSELLGNGERRSTMSTALGHGDFEKFEDDDEDDVIRLEDGELLRDGEEEEEQEGLYEGPPTTLLAELQLRKQRHKERTRPVASAYPNGMHSTLLELDAVAQVEQKTRGQKRVNLAWEDPSGFDKDSGDEGDEDVPLAMLFPPKSRAHQDQSRPMGLMERREMEDNEPLSQRRDRLQGRPRAMPRASTMMGGLRYTESAEDDGETLAQRIERLKAQGGTATGLPSARPVSGDFSTELMLQFGTEAMKENNKGKDKETPTPPEEEETLGQRRKRLQAEREAREKEVAAGATTPQDERPVLKKQHSLAGILSAHPSAGAGNRLSSYSKPATGLLGLHEQHSARRSSTMLNLQNAQQSLPPRNSYNTPRTQSFTANNAFANNAFANPYAAAAMGGGGFAYNPMGGFGLPVQVQNPMAAQMLQMQRAMAEMGVGAGQPLNQGQIDMVERWRQSVMQ